MQLDVRPPPVTDLTVAPTAEEVEQFRQQGYLVVDRLTTDEEIDWLAELFEQIFDPANAGSAGAPVDRSADVGPDGINLLAQAFFPEFHHPELLRTAAHRNARRYAAALLGVDASDLRSWGHMIRKAPGGAEAPWHQDEAFWEPELEYHALGCWLPLHDVTEEMGAMQFVPGSHRQGLFDHHPKGDPAMHVLTTDADTSGHVVCPLRKGGATFHDKDTLHHTATNGTDRARLAFPVEFQIAPRRRRGDIPVRPWVDEWRAISGGTAPAEFPADGRLLPIEG
jgi:ectoine hydroxylase-related dioxygenase (phytanoyl-CoA dioxygenase family)